MIRPYDKALSPTVADHERSEARRLNVSPPYNVWNTAEDGRFKGRMNPWHQDLDDKMFWI